MEEEDSSIHTSTPWSPSLHNMFVHLMMTYFINLIGLDLEQA